MDLEALRVLLVDRVEALEKLQEETKKRDRAAQATVLTTLMSLIVSVANETRCWAWNTIDGPFDSEDSALIECDNGRS